ncbi:MAG: hypothetical protein ABEI58_01565 [Candidatus Nanohaloarchaea archaeon]
MAGTLLTAYALIATGVILEIAAYAARRKGSERYRYIALPGAVSLAAGLLLLMFFISVFR